MAVAVHAVRQAGDVRGSKIAVLGAGPIGNLVAQTALGMGAESVLITDTSGLRLEKAKECGIKHTADTQEEDFGEAMIRVFGPDKADVICDCARQQHNNRSGNSACKKGQHNYSGCCICRNGRGGSGRTQ